MKCSCKNLDGRQRCRWENNIKTNLTRIGCENVEWIYMAKITIKLWAIVTQYLNFRLQKRAVNFYTYTKQIAYNSHSGFSQTYVCLSVIFPSLNQTVHVHWILQDSPYSTLSSVCYLVYVY
jgi:hypothetical protein